MRNQREPDPSLVAEALRVLRAAVVTEPGTEARNLAEQDLGAALLTQYEGTSDASLVHEVADVLGTLLGRTPGDSPELPGRQERLALALETRAEITGDVEDARRGPVF